MYRCFTSAVLMFYVIFNKIFVFAYIVFFAMINPHECEFYAESADMNLEADTLSFRAPRCAVLFRGLNYNSNH